MDQASANQFKILWYITEKIQESSYVTYTCHTGSHHNRFLSNLMYGYRIQCAIIIFKILVLDGWMTDGLLHFLSDGAPQSQSDPVEQSKRQFVLQNNVNNGAFRK